MSRSKKSRRSLRNRKPHFETLEDRTLLAVYFEDFNSGLGGWSVLPDSGGSGSATYHATGGVGNSGYMEGVRHVLSPNFDQVGGRAIANATGNLAAIYGDIIHISYSGKTFTAIDTPSTPVHSFWHDLYAPSGGYSPNRTAWAKYVTTGPPTSNWQNISFEINTSWTDSEAQANGWERRVGSRSWQTSMADITFQFPFVGLGGHSGNIVAGLDNFRMASTGQEPDIITKDATTNDFQNFDIDYSITDADAPAFIFRAYISSDDKFDPGTAGGTDLPLGQVGIDDPADRSIGEHVDENGVTLTLASRAPIDEDHRFVLIVADPDNAIEEVDESSGEVGENNVAYAIPILDPDETIDRFGVIHDAYTRADESAASGEFTAHILPGTDDFEKLKWLDSDPHDGPWPYEFLHHSDRESTDELKLEDQRAQESAKTSLGAFVQFIAADANDWSNARFSINEAYDSTGGHQTQSLHYEGRALDIQDTSSNNTVTRTGRLSGLAWLAGFDFVYFETKNISNVGVLHVSSQPSFVPTVNANSLQDAVDAAISLGYIDSQMAQPLNYKLKNLGKFIENGNIPAAYGMLGAFKNQVEAQKGKKIDEKFADLLLGNVFLLQQQIDPFPSSATATEIDPLAPVLVDLFMMDI